MLDLHHYIRMIAFAFMLYNVVRLPTTPQRQLRNKRISSLKLSSGVNVSVNGCWFPYWTRDELATHPRCSSSLWAAGTGASNHLPATLQGTTWWVDGRADGRCVCCSPLSVSSIFPQQVGHPYESGTDPTDPVFSRSLLWDFLTFFRSFLR